LLTRLYGWKLDGAVLRLDEIQVGGVGL